jgi:UDPglucose 6-dehydrogenase
MNNAATLLSDSVAYAQNIYDSVVGVYAIFHVTEWKEFRMPNWVQILSLVSNALLIDGRNVFGREQLPDGFDYLCIGEKTDR